MDPFELSKKIKDITGYDPNEPVGPDAPIRAAKGLGRAWESMGGAPTRAALMALQEGTNPLKAFKDQFGENPDTAPTAKQLVENDPITAPYADTLLTPTVGVAADVSNIALPGLAKMLGKAPKMAKAPMAGEITPENVKAAQHVANIADPSAAKFQLELNPEVYKYKHGLLEQRPAFMEGVEDVTIGPGFFNRQKLSPEDIAASKEVTRPIEASKTAEIPIEEIKKAAGIAAVPAAAALSEQEQKDKFQGLRKLLNK